MRSQREDEARGFVDLGYAKLDVDRERRCGLPEVVFCPGKRPEQIVEILAELRRHSSLVLATRAAPEIAEAVRRRFPEARFHEEARLIALGEPRERLEGQVAVLTAGTADRPVAEEAAVTAELLGCPVSRLQDVGVAGVHRLLAHQDLLRSADVLIVVAGMDGVLPSLVGGLVDKPVIAVPTSTGYGAHFQGLAPLLTMLNSCAPGVAVVNIDNGFGAGVFAARILSMRRS
jgi:hypothetical protein